jgi:hypothetical protein
MIFIRRFLDKMSVAESKKTRDIVIPIDDARGLRDDITKLLSDLYEKEKSKPEPVIELQIKGGSFK